MAITEVGEEAENLDLPGTAGGNGEWDSPSGKRFDGFLPNLVCTYWNPVITALDIHPRNMKTLHTKTCTQTFTTALFRNSPKLKTPEHLSTGAQLNKL